jgi:purine-binding chemotaxis protein CheW
MAEAGPHLIVDIGDRLWAVPARAIDAVVDVPPITPLPLVPRHVNGLAAVRGAVVLVIDLCVLLDNPPLPHSPGQMMVVLLGSDGLRIGVRISSVIGLNAITEAHINALEGNDNVISWQSRQVSILAPEALDLGEVAGPDGPREGASEARVASIATRVETVLAVRVGSQDALLPITMVEEVMPAGSLHAIPQAVVPVLGARIVRERLMLVLSLAHLSGLRTGQAGFLIVATGLDRHVFALAVDGVLGLRQYPADRRIMTPDSGAFAEAFVENDGNITPLLDRTVLEHSIETLLGRYGGFLEQPTPKAVPTPAYRIVTFMVEGQLFGLDAHVVHRVTNWHPPVAVPPNPAQDDADRIDRVVHVAEQVLPVYDLRQHLNIVSSQSSPAAWLIVERHDGPWALAVDAMPALASIPKSHVDPAADKGLLAAAFRQSGTLGWLLSLDRNVHATAA